MPQGFGLRRLFGWGSLHRSAISVGCEPTGLLTAPAHCCKECATALVLPLVPEKHLSSINRKAHPALLEGLLQELLTHCFHIFIFFFCLPQAPGMGKQMQNSLGWTSLAHSAERCWGHRIPACPSVTGAGGRRAAANLKQRARGGCSRQPGHAGLSPQHECGLNLDQKPTYHSLLFLRGNHKQTGLSK